MPLRRAYFALALLLAVSSVVYATGLPWLAWDAVTSDCNGGQRSRHRHVEAGLRGRPGRPCFCTLAPPLPMLGLRESGSKSKRLTRRLSLTSSIPTVLPFTSPADFVSSTRRGRRHIRAWEMGHWVSAIRRGSSYPGRIVPELCGLNRYGSNLRRTPLRLIHFEPADLICLTAPIIGAAISYDYGMTWEDRGPIIEPSNGLDCDYDNGYFSGGNGDFSVLPGRGGKYFYFLFTSYAGPSEAQGIGIARSLIADRGQPGTVFKYYGNAWNEPALGGRFTPLFGPARAGRGRTLIPIGARAFTGTRTSTPT